MADQPPSVSSDISSTLHPASGVGCAGDARLECDRSLLRNLKRDVSDIESSLQNLSKFEEDLSNHMKPLQTRVMGGNITPDEICALLDDPIFAELKNAVSQFKLQLPFTSYFKFSGTQDGNSNSTNCDNDCNYYSEAPIDPLGEYDNNLTTKEKDCLYYCSVFDAEIKKRELINWWIGEELLQDSIADSSGRVKKLEHVGEEILQGLEGKKFISRIHKKKRASDAWLMEASVRTLVRSKAKEKGLFNFDEKILSEKAMLLRSDNQIDPLLDSSSADRVKTVFNVDRLRIDESEAKALALMDLTVLHLGRSQPKQHIHVKSHKLIMKRLKKMKHLRLLSLQGIPFVTELPDSISGLTSLLVLDLRACQALESLPSSIGKLKKLTRLDMSGCYILQPLPKEVSLLSNLEVLKGFVIGNTVSTKGSKICRLHDLRLLKKLYKLSISVWKKNFPQSQDLKDLAKIEGLVKLKIQWIPAPKQDRETTHSDRNQQVQNEQGQQNADQAVNLPAESSRNWTRKMFKCCWLLNRSSGEDETVEDETEVQEKLEKLDLWFAPEDAGLMLLAPKNFIALKTLYIRWTKFQHLNCNLNANEEDKWNVETLRLLNLPNLEVRWEDLKNLFPKMSYLEVQDCPKLEVSEYLDDEGVWKDQIPVQTSVQTS